MRMIDYPVCLPFTVLTPMGGPQSLGVTESETANIQNVINPFGAWRFQVDYPSMRGGFSRAFKRLTTSSMAGTNCFRFPFRDTTGEPTWREMGYAPPPHGGVPWSNGRSWSNGKNWSASKPIVPVTAASAKGSATITLDLTLWGGVVPAFFGLVGHFAVYSVIGVAAMSGNVATLRVWPPVRRAVSAEDYATLRPVLAARTSGAAGGSWSDGPSRLRGARLDMVEVPDEVVLSKVSEDTPYG